MRQTALNLVYDLAKKDDRIMFVGSDLGNGVLQKFKEEMPTRFLMEGISEQYLVGMSAGLAMEGKIPYVNTIGTFLTRRCFEQIVLDMCLHNQKVRLISSGGGLVYAPLGPTHLAIEDIAILRPIPNLCILVPADAEEMRRLMPLTVDYPGPIYIRVAKGGDPIVTSDKEAFAIGKIFPMRAGKDAAIITTGITLKLALEAADALASKGVYATVVHMPTIKPFPEKALLEVIANIPAIVTVEEHVMIGGLGSAVAETICDAQFEKGKKFKRIGIPDSFPHEYGSQDSLLKHCGITTDRIISAVEEVVQR